MPSRTDSPHARIDRGRTAARSRSTAPSSPAIPATRWRRRSLANGVRVVARSIYLDRPRGILSAGVEEPNAFVGLDLGTHTQPSARATTVELYDGLAARSLGRPRARGRDARPVALRPQERALRRAGGRRRPGGPGRGAARPPRPAPGSCWSTSSRSSAARCCTPARRSTTARRGVGGRHGRRARRARREVTVLPRTTALGVFDDGYVVAVERRTEHLPPGDARCSRASASGTSARAASCWPPARSSGRSSSPTTTGPA